MESPRHRLYGDLAWLFPILTPLAQYGEETDRFADLIRGRAGILVRSLLHLGCGAGHNDFTFKRHFDLTGVDRSAEMLDMAGKLNPEAAYVQGDFRTIRLGRTFDAVAAVDSLDYLRTADDWRAVAQTAYVHLNPGGIFFFLLEQTRETFLQNNTVTNTRAFEGGTVTVIEHMYDPDPADTSYESTFVFIIRRGGTRTVESEIHELGLFSAGELAAFLEEAGFRTERLTYAPPASAVAGSGLTGQETFPMFIGLKPLVR